MSAWKTRRRPETVRPSSAAATPSSTAALEQLGELPMHAFLNAQANAYCGNVDKGFEWLERAYAQRNAGLGQLRVISYFHELHHDPRWLPFLRKMGLSTQSE